MTVPTVVLFLNALALAGVAVVTLLKAGANHEEADPRRRLLPVAGAVAVLMLGFASVAAGVWTLTGVVDAGHR